MGEEMKKRQKERPDRVSWVDISSLPGIRAFTAVVLALASGVVHAAGFDCTRASDSAEKLVCTDVELSKLDDDLTAAYTQMLRKGFTEDIFKTQQRGWLVNVRNRCESKECLKQAYMQRLKQLAFINDLPLKSLTAGRSADASGCKLIAEFASNRALNLLNPWFLAKPATEKQLTKIFEEDANFFESTGYWTVDLNNDGVRDHLTITMAGTMRIATVFARSGRPSGKPVKLSGYEDFDQDISLIAVGGRYYFWGDDTVWRLDKDGAFEVACRILQGPSQMVQVKGEQDRVCSLAAQDALAPVEFKLQHQMAPLPSQGIFWSKNPLDGLARVDIDNDGQLDNIVQLDFNNGAGRGCSTTYVAVANANATALPENDLNRLLMDEIGGVRCGPRVEVVTYDGITYIDAKSSDRRLYRIKGTKAETVCEFEERQSFQALIE